ncbi:MAG: ATP-binding protein [Oscillospiraceae bacterium]|nr:ATP-binding protein [Oscillospiraceae bacterium]MBR4341271.1 ATP-binding protein [Lachnospiraceae bacterium]
MLLEFKTKNYKSFAEEMVFSMIPSPKQKGLDYSILSMKVGDKTYKGLSSAVIYGPNASGKTNVIGAMDTFRCIVMRGNIRNADVATPNAAASALELIPNCNGVKEPTEFSVRFVDGELMVEYFLKADLGTFMDSNFQRRILEERLVVNEKQVFSRNGMLTVDLPSVIKEYVNKSIKRKTPKMLELAEDSLSDTDLFLNNGFKSIYAAELVKRILSWFSDKFIVVYRSDDMRLVRKFADPKANTVYVETTLTEAAREFGITANALGYKATGRDDSEDAVLCSILGDKLIPAEMFESYGTIRFINEFPLVILALLSGGTLVMDEFDASIHPMALMNIINIFHNDDINKNHAQLIINTHNPIFLDASLLRRDEIKFVEREDETGNSVHYSLSDFKTVNGNRKGEDYMNNYFVSRYGAIKDIDFSTILEKVISKGEVTADER